MPSNPPALNHVYTGDSLDVMRGWPDSCVHCCVTSPPYWGLRDYGVAGQLGLERTPAEYVQKIVAVFEEVRRVLRPDGTLWLNLGDSYADSGRGGNPTAASSTLEGSLASQEASIVKRTQKRPPGLKQKDLIGIPWMVAFALRDAGWWLRSDIIWAKPNAMPESVTDRPSCAHEHIFLLSKSAKYYYDAAALRSPLKPSSKARLAQNVEAQNGSPRANGGAKSNGNMHAVTRDKQRGHSRKHEGFTARWDSMSYEEQRAGGANARTVWEIATRPFKAAHFATFPEELARRCILAGCPLSGVVIDPFIGSGTTGRVAQRLGRHFVGIELNPDYAEMARERCQQSGIPFEAAQHE